MRRLPVRVARHDRADQVLHVPACAPCAWYSGCTNSAASQSSSSGCVGHSPCDPRSSSTFERPVPKNCAPDAIHEDARGQRILCATPASSPDRAASRGARRCRACRGSRESRAARSRPNRPSSFRAPESASRRASTASVTTTRGIALLQQRRGLLPLRRAPPRSACASGDAHWKCAAIAAFCAVGALLFRHAAARAAPRPESLCPSRPSATSTRSPRAPAGTVRAWRAGIRNPAGCARSSPYPPRSPAAARSAAPAYALRGFVIRVDRPAGLRIAVDRARRQILRCLDCSDSTCP